MPKLTLKADEQVIEQAKKLAADRGTSVSAMFSQFIEAMSTPQPRRRPLAPITRRLRGVAHAATDKSDRALFEEAIREKYGR